ncbi:exported hypothetical protein [Azospirillaceae bacterium]
MTSFFSKVFSAAIVAGFFAASPAVAPVANAGEITAHFSASTPIGNGTSNLLLDFTLNATDYITHYVNEDTGDIYNSYMSGANIFGAYTVQGITGTLSRIYTNGSPTLTANITGLQPIGTQVGAAGDTSNNSLFPLLLDISGNAIGTDTGRATNVEAFAFDSAGIAFRLTGSNSILAQLAADANNSGLYLLFPSSYLDGASSSIALLGTNPTTRLPHGSAGNPAGFVFTGFDSVTEVPAPAPLALLGVGFLGIGVLRRRRQTV